MKKEHKGLGGMIYTEDDFTIPESMEPEIEPYAGGNRFEKPYTDADQPLQDLGFLDVTRPPFSADPTGTVDATDALNACIAAAQRYQLVCWIPLGTYLISDTLVCRQCIDWDYPADVYRVSARRYPVVIMGQRKWQDQGLLRPRIILREHAPGFDYPEQPKPMMNVFYGKESAAHAAPASIENVITGLHLIIAPGNRGAMGVDFYAAQGCSLEDCLIDVGDGLCGIWGSAGNGGSHCQCVIRGGKVGLLIEKGTPGAVFSGFTLDHQRDHAVVAGGKQAVDLVGCRILTDAQKPPVVSFGGQYDLINQGQLSLIDCSIEFDHPLSDGRIQAAISSRESLYLRHVYVRNATHIVWNPDGTQLPCPGADWCCTDEWAHGVSSMPHEGRIYTSPIYCDGKRTEDTVFSRGVHPALLPDDLITRHQSSLPFLEDCLDWNVRKYGVYGDGVHDDTEALQHVIDTHKVVFLPKGYYRITDTLHLRADTCLIGVAQNLSQILVTQVQEGAFATCDTTAPALDTPDTDSACVTLAYCGIVTARQLPSIYALRWRVAGDSLLRNFSFYADPGYRFTFMSGDRHAPWILVTGHGGGRWFHFWCDQTQGGKDYRILRVQHTHGPFVIYACNPEHSRSDYEMDIIDSENVTIYNLKSECNAPNLHILRSKNIAVFSSGGDATAMPGHALYHIEDSSDLLLTLLYDYRIFSSGHGPEYFSGTWVDPCVWSMVALTENGHTEYTTPCERPCMYRVGTYHDLQMHHPQKQV